MATRPLPDIMSRDVAVEKVEKVERVEQVERFVLWQTSHLRIFQKAIKDSIFLIAATAVHIIYLRDITSLHLTKMRVMILRKWYHFKEPPVEEGKVRIRWTCQCGTELWDDFKELIPGAAENLRHQLDVYARKATHDSQGLANEAQPSHVASHPGRNRSDLTEAHPLPTPSESASRQSRSIVSTETSAKPPSQDPPGGDQKFLLLCLSKTSDTLWLFQLNVEHVTSDFSLFRMLRTAYMDYHGLLARFFSPKSLASINFIKVSSTLQ